jgi:hypothetical protein
MCAAAIARPPTNNSNPAESASRRGYGTGADDTASRRAFADTVQGGRRAWTRLNVHGNVAAHARTVSRGGRARRRGPAFGGGRARARGAGSREPACAVRGGRDPAHPSLRTQTYVLAQGLLAAHQPVPERVRLLRLSPLAGRPRGVDDGALRGGRLACARARRGRHRSPVLLGRSARERICRLPRHAARIRSQLHGGLPRVGRRARAEPRAVAPHQRGRAHARGDGAAAPAQREHGADAGEHQPAPVRKGHAAPPRARQAAERARADDARSRRARDPLHQRHPARHRRDPARARGELARHPCAARGARAHPGGHRAELPHQARDPHGLGARAGRSRGGARREPRAPHPARRGERAIAAQPQPPRHRALDRRGHQRLRRHLPREPRLHQPRPSLAAPDAQCAALGFELSPRLPIYPRYAADPRFVDAGLVPAIARQQARLRALGGLADLAPRATLVQAMESAS